MNCQVLSCDEHAIELIQVYKNYLFLVWVCEKHLKGIEE
jgi:hypothetical protein